MVCSKFLRVIQPRKYDGGDRHRIGTMEDQRHSLRRYRWCGLRGITVAVLMDEDSLIVAVPARGPVTADDSRADTTVVPAAADDADVAVSLVRLALGHCGRSRPYA